MVFIGAGNIAQRAAEEDLLRVLEVGLGTGLNFLLTADAVHAGSATLEYTALENCLITPELFTQLDYAALLQNPVYALRFAESLGVEQAHDIHTDHGSPWFTHDRVSLDVRLGDAVSARLADQHHDVIYHDAFSPVTSPALWQYNFLSGLIDSLRPGGVLVTYCAKGAVRRDLIRTGATVERLPGPPGKREMLRATRPMS